MRNCLIRPTRPSFLYGLNLQAHASDLPKDDQEHDALQCKRKEDSHDEQLHGTFLKALPGPAALLLLLRQFTTSTTTTTDYYYDYYYDSLLLLRLLLLLRQLTTTTTV